MKSKCLKKNKTQNIQIKLNSGLLKNNNIPHLLKKKKKKKIDQSAK